MGEPRTEHDFWTFLIRGFTTKGSQATVTGWFIVCRIRSVDPTDLIPMPMKQTIHLEYLTPQAAPVELDVSSFMPPKTTLEEISPKRICDALENVLGLPFQGIPKAPIALPLHRIPPSRRKKIERAQSAHEYLPTRRKR